MKRSNLILERLRQRSDHQINIKNKAMMLFLMIVFLGAIVLGIFCLIPGFTFPIKDRQGHNVSQSIASLEKVNLGGQEQWILIRSMDITKPRQFKTEVQRCYTGTEKNTS
jgi:hypothetical protein